SPGLRFSSLRNVGIRKRSRRPAGFSCERLASTVPIDRRSSEEEHENADRGQRWSAPRALARKEIWVWIVGEGAVGMDEAGNRLRSPSRIDRPRRRSPDETRASKQKGEDIDASLRMDC